MLVYLSYSEILKRQRTLRSEFESLLAIPSIVLKRNAKQWRFFRSAFESLFGDNQNHFQCGAKEATQYRHAVERKLGAYYGGGGSEVRRYRFWLMARRTALAEGYIDNSYPACDGYVVVVGEWSPERRTAALRRRDYFERLVMEVMEAEWAVYLRCPDLDLSPLEGKVLEGSPMYVGIYRVAERNQQRRWMITNPGNPSNKRLLEVSVGKLHPDQVRVRTREYWLLDWWSVLTSDYTYPYHENNPQTYTFVQMDGLWLATTNDRPPPRFSVFRTGVHDQAIRLARTHGSRTNRS
jgi:hypothetical protein